MNLNTLIRLVSTATPSNDDEAKEFADMLNEMKALDAILAYSRNDEIWHDQVSFISLSNIIDILNEHTYDMYGKLARKYGKDVPVAEYIKEFREDFMAHSCCDDFTDSMLQSGWDFLSDLWQDNEREGNNNPDGTFNKNS